MYLQYIHQNTMENGNIVFSRKEAVETAKNEYYANKAIIEEVC